MIKCQLGVNVGSLTSKKTRREFSSNEQMLSGYWVGISSLHAINTEHSFVNQQMLMLGSCQITTSSEAGQPPELLLSMWV